MHTPGHTPACVSYRIGDAVFVGDTMFMPDYGTARTDFPGGCARQLYRSIHKLLSLPPGTRLFMCHDYKAPGRDRFAWETTVAEQRRANQHIHDGVGEDEFVAMREARDRTLATPKLLIPSIQVNMRAGRFPPAEGDGVRYLRIPVKLKAGADPEAVS
jgi:glyoxylase-like metal-dependent hydrolase (beta-lactamase superfamily II)